MTDTVLTERAGRVLFVILNRPQVLNALSGDMFDALYGHLEQASVDDAIGAVVLTGAGRGFCSGGDLRNKADEIRRDAELPPQQRKRPQTFEQNVAVVRRWTRAVELLHAMAKPTIAMINGPCAGAGLSLAGACDLRFAAESAVFTSAFVKAGLPGDFGGVWLWSRILGEGKARELYFLSEKMNASTAKDFGLVHRVAPDASLRDMTLGHAAQLADWPAHLGGYVKQNFAFAAEADLGRFLDVETKNMILATRAWLKDEPKAAPAFSANQAER